MKGKDYLDIFSSEGMKNANQDRKVKKFFRYIIMQDSPLDGMTAAMSLMKGE